MLQKLWRILTLNCEDASRLTSDAFDRRLTRSERAALHCHLVLCWSCRHFRRHLNLLAEALQYLAGTARPGPAASRLELSVEAKRRLELSVKRELER